MRFRNHRFRRRHMPVEQNGIDEKVVPEGFEPDRLFIPARHIRPHRVTDQHIGGRRRISAGFPAVPFISAVDLHAVSVAAASAAFLPGAAWTAHHLPEKLVGTFEHGFQQIIAPDSGRLPGISHVRKESEVIGISLHGRPDLFQVRNAGCLIRPFARLIQRGQQHGGQNRDDRYSNDDAINKFYIISSLSSTHILCLYLCRVAILPD